MPVHLRALVVIIAVSVVGFYLVAPLVRRHGFQSDLRIWVKSWFFVTLAAFLSHNIVIFFFLLAAYLFIAVPKTPSVRLPLYLLLVLALPNVSMQIPGFGLINYLADFSYARLLVISLLLPCLIVKQVDGVRAPRIGSLKTDKYVFIFALLCAVLDFRGVSFTEGLRQSSYYVIDVILPYYVFSRYVTSEEDIRKILFGLLIPILIMAIMAFPESLKGWHFYTSLEQVFGIPKSITAYKFRLGLLRAHGPYGNINFGLLIALAFAGLLYLRQGIIGRNFYIMSFCLLGALVLTFSRGPWVAFAGMIILYIAISRETKKALSIVILIGVLTSPLLLFTDLGNRILEILPFIGAESAQSNVTYRQNLMSVGFEVANQAPFFGYPNVYDHPEMQIMRQGEGIIDIVNTYLEYLLSYGYVGLTAFVLIFLSILNALWRTRVKLGRFGYEREYDLANIFIIMLAASLVLIATVSSLGHGIVSISYWVLAGLSAAFLNQSLLVLREHHRSN